MLIFISELFMDIHFCPFIIFFFYSDISSNYLRDVLISLNSKSGNLLPEVRDLFKGKNIISYYFPLIIYINYLGLK